MQYNRKALLYRRNTIESDGLDTFQSVLIGQYSAKVRYNQGIVKKHSQNGNITELNQDITVLIPRRISIENLTALKDTGYLTIDGISYLVNSYIISDVLNTVILYCRRGEI